MREQIHFPDNAKDIVRDLVAKLDKLLDCAEARKSAPSYLRQLWDDLSTNLEYLPHQWCGKDPLVEPYCNEYSVATRSFCFEEEIDGDLVPSDWVEVPYYISQVVNHFYESLGQIPSNHDEFTQFLIQFVIKVRSHLVDLQRGWKLREQAEPRLADKTESTEKQDTGAQLQQLVTPEDNVTAVFGSPEQIRFFEHSNFRHIEVPGQSFDFTQGEAAVIRFMHERHSLGQSYVTKDELLSEFRPNYDKKTRIRDLFSGKNRDTYSFLIRKVAKSQDRYYLYGFKPRE